MFVFDIDGVLTPKTWGVNINQKLTNDEIKRRIRDADGARDGFALLNCFFMGYVYLFRCIEKRDDSRAWNRINFLTGRKKSEYEEATLKLFQKWMNSQGMEGPWAHQALSRVIWYPEGNDYKKETYYKWKIVELHNLWEKYGLVTYIDDDADLVEAINKELSGKAKGVTAFHFEGKDPISGGKRK